MHLIFPQALLWDACAFSLVATEIKKDTSPTSAWEATQNVMIEKSDLYSIQKEVDDQSAELFKSLQNH